MTQMAREATLAHQHQQQQQQQKIPTRSRTPGIPTSSSQIHSSRRPSITLPGLANRRKSLNLARRTPGTGLLGLNTSGGGSGGGGKGSLSASPTSDGGLAAAHRRRRSSYSAAAGMLTADQKTANSGGTGGGGGGGSPPLTRQSSLPTSSASTASLLGFSGALPTTGGLSLARILGDAWIACFFRREADRRQQPENIAWMTSGGPMFRWFVQQQQIRKKVSRRVSQGSSSNDSSSEGGQEMEMEMEEEIFGVWQRPTFEQQR